MELPTMKVNPWDVDTLDVYLHYCCPECDHKSKTKLLFVNHAFSCHPDAKGPSMSLPTNFSKGAFNNYVYKKRGRESAKSQCLMSIKIWKKISYYRKHFIPLCTELALNLICIERLK